MWCSKAVMKSSVPVFTRQNPFEQASKVVKTHYHPASNKSLSQKEKQTTFSPERFSKRSSAQFNTLRPEDQGLTEKQDSCFTATEGHPVFEESWPSSDCGSSPASILTSSNMVSPKQSARAGKHSTSLEPGVQQDSVLSKYIERFRHGRPQSREERQQMASSVREKSVPFWWITSSTFPPSSTPTKTTDKDVTQPLKDAHGAFFYSPVQYQRDRSLSPCRRSLSILSDTSQGEYDDTEILQLQDRANRLLLRDETLNDGSIHVSSEGLGCSDFSSPCSIEEPVRRPVIPGVTMSAAEMASSDSIQAHLSQNPSVVPSLEPPTRPEDDILFQWRLRRKIEQAREWPQKHSGFYGPTTNHQSLSQTSASGQAYEGRVQPPEFSEKVITPEIAGARLEPKVNPGSFSPSSGPAPLPAFVVSGSSVSQPHVPAHMHFLCDVLPCPSQTFHASTHDNIFQSRDESRTKIVFEKAQAENKMKTAPDDPFLEHIPTPSNASSGATKGERPSNHKRSERNKREKAQTKESENNKKETVMSFRKQKKSTRHTMEKEHSDGPGSTNRSSSHQRYPERILPLAKEQQQQEGRFSSQSSTDAHAPPHSPIHSALGQVVSEVLFPMTESSPAPRMPVSSSPSCTSAARTQSSVLPCDEQNSVEVISQLLQEAEDSDEKEFEDDALLKVLRKQRKWVKEQISEVDFLLNGFLDEQHAT
ncbi:proline and serine-rich protein 3 isoform X1 [Labrus bergylta]|uniref:Proline and serine rich 3 n=1 Tax=Labrus bergylta TaxID=56723 RepID=A0A3Q3F350_9LABR|nr:proline and serine-rich protein 3 isoform X1 [Labrus bergylta]